MNAHYPDQADKRHRYAVQASGHNVALVSSSQGAELCNVIQKPRFRFPAQQMKLVFLYLISSSSNHSTLTHYQH